MVTDTGARSEMVQRVLQPGEGYTFPTHTHTCTKECKIHRKIGTRIRALGEAVALSNLITFTGGESISLYLQGKNICVGASVGGKKRESLCER